MSVEINVEVECPYCGRRDFHDIDALVDSGGVPQNEIHCGGSRGCGGKFVVEACIDLAVIPTDGVSP